MQLVIDDRKAIKSGSFSAQDQTPEGDRQHAGVLDSRHLSRSKVSFGTDPYAERFRRRTMLCLKVPEILPGMLSISLKGTDEREIKLLFAGEELLRRDWSF